MTARDQFPLRVVALLDTAQVSGPGRQLAAVAVHLAHAGVELRVLTFHRAGRPPSPYPAYLSGAGVRHGVVPENGPLDIRLIRRVRETLFDWQPDIVQTHGYRPTALAFALRRSGAPWPWIAFLHGGTSENSKVKFYHWLERRLLHAADRVVVMSRQQKTSLSGLGDKVEVLHNAAIAIPATSSPGTDWKDPAGRDTPRLPLLGVVGRLSPEKGVDIFLRACRELARRNVDFTAIVAGDGPERRHLLRLRDALCLAERVRFVGAVTAVEQLYAQLNLLVIPSHSEGLPNVLLEALRADVPVAATRVGGIPEVLESSQAGVLSRPGDPVALADAIVRGLSLKADPASRAARREAVERFSPERRTQAHMQLYQDVLLHHRARIAS